MNALLNFYFRPVCDNSGNRVLCQGSGLDNRDARARRQDAHEQYYLHAQRLADHIEVWREVGS